MSRPQKIHPPIKATFKQVLGAVAAGNIRSARMAAKNAESLSKTKKCPPTAKPD